MPTYIALLKFTDQGIQNVKDITERTRSLVAGGQVGGNGRLIGLWGTMGAYDAVLIGEWPDDESASAAALTSGLQGNFRGETMRAFTVEELQRIVERLP